MNVNDFRFEILTSHCNLKGKGLEIGPSYNPICPKKKGFDVEIIDHCSKTELLKKYENDLSQEQKDNIEDVDYIWNGQAYSELTGKNDYYDYIIASNLIEHVTDIIGFFYDCSKMLKENGVLSLAIPDKRFCFDYYRPLTSIQKVIDRHATCPEKHSEGAIAEYCLNVVKSNGAISWNIEQPNSQDTFSSVCNDQLVRLAIDNNRNGEFMDIHDWVFTPTSFRLLVRDLYSLGYIDFSECMFCSTPSNSYEFYIILKKDADKKRIINQEERQKLLSQIDYEEKYITAGIPQKEIINEYVFSNEKGIGPFGENIPNNPKRLVLFHLYSKRHEVERYVVFLLANLHKYCDKIVVISNGELKNQEKEKLIGIADEVYCRTNQGYDFGGWRDGVVNYIGFDSLKQYDEVIFCNDSIYGPISSLDDMFNEMSKRPVDFWGVTGMPQWKGFTGIQTDEIYPSHIQSYFFVIRNRLLCSDAFKDYWSKLDPPEDHANAVYSCETKMTEYFYSKGFDWDVYVDMGEYTDTPERTYIPYLCQHRKLIEKNGMPFVKRNIFSQPKAPVFDLCNCDDAYSVLKYVKESTDYDVDIIWEDLVKNRPIRSLFDSLHLNFVLNEQQVTAKSMTSNLPKIALFLHSYFEDLIPYCVKYALSMPYYADIIVTTDCERKKELIQQAFESVGRKIKEIRVVNNRGREMRALLVGCSDLLLDYDYICFMHDKKSTQDLKPIGESFCNILFENLLCTPEYVQNIINTFESEPRLGLLGAPRPFMDGYKGSIGVEWLSEFKTTEKLLKKAGVNVPVAHEYHPFVLGSCFWCRSKILKKLIGLHLSEADFAEEPLPCSNTLNHALERSFEYFAADAGYYVGLTMTSHYASLNISNLQYMTEHPTYYFPTQLIQYVPVEQNSNIQEQEISIPQENPETLNIQLSDTCQPMIPGEGIFVRIPLKWYNFFHKYAPKKFRKKIRDKYLVK